jgi:predicted transcriptional regulator
VGKKGIDPGYSPNSYPMTDAKKHPSIVVITLNDLEPQTVPLEDDPADHRGLLSWISQKRGVLTWQLARYSFDWRLNEAGSYGYLVRLKYGGEALAKALGEHTFRIRLAVDNATPDFGGLAIYGENFGRYPVDPAVVLHLK